MSCNEYKDNRNTCGETLPSSCVPYTGYISDDIKKELQCKPNINDILKSVQVILEELDKKLGDNSKLSLTCLSDKIDSEFSQEALNQLFADTLCELKEYINNNTLDISTATLAINILCLNDPTCEPKENYTVKELFTKFISGYCDLLNRVKTIENILNI